jgi:hypothetical protein
MVGLSASCLVVFINSSALKKASTVSVATSIVGALVMYVIKTDTNPPLQDSNPGQFSVFWCLLL